MDKRSNITDKTVHKNKTNSYNQLKSNIKQYYSEYKLLTTYVEYMNSIDSRMIKYRHKCGVIQETLYPSVRCNICYPYDNMIGKREVLEFCRDLHSDTESNSRVIDSFNLDIYIPSCNVAIEFDGLSDHSSYTVETESKDYHLNKTKECEKKDIHLFHIFENEWVDMQKNKIWKSIILNKLGKSRRIYARKCIISKISNERTSEFLDDNHIQGKCISSKNLGLLIDDELVSIMTFGKSRYDKKIDWELIRFCNKVNTSVVGAASRLLKAFRSTNHGSIVSYADKRRSNGNLYKMLNFTLTHESGPNYFYWKDAMELESRVKYQKHKLHLSLPIFDDKKTESENMYINNYKKIFDCGNQVWRLDAKEQKFSDFFD